MIETKQRTRRAAAAVAAGLSLAVACCLWPSRAAAQQWTTSGHNITNTNPGNVTVRSDADVSPLLVRGANSNVLGFVVSNDEAGSKGWAFQVTGSDNPYAALPGSLVFRQATDNFNPMTISPAGNVGVGTTSPLVKLHVQQTSGNVNAARFTTSDFIFGSAGTSLGLKSIAASGNTAYAVQTFTAGETTAGSLVLQDQGGNVGVGTTTPGYKLDVLGAVNASGGLCIGGACKSSWAEVGGSGQWATGGGSTLSYSAGNVGIGTAAPSAKLDVVQANGAAIRALSGSAAAHASVQLGRAAPEFSLGIAASAGNYVADARAGDIVFRTEDAGKRLLFANGPGASGLALANGNVSIGTTALNSAARLYVAGNVNATGDISADGNIAAKYQDLAEWVPATQELAPGTVVVLDGARSNHVLASASAYDARVAGVVSAQPGIILGEAGAGKVKVATTGRVRVKVDATRGPIRIGDLLVTSDAAGVAMKSEPVRVGGVTIHRPGTIIGKALEPLEKGVGEILVLLSLQ